MEYLPENKVRSHHPLNHNWICKVSFQLETALLTDLLEAFNCLDYELLIAKLNASGLSLPALRLIHDYLSNRKQRAKTNCFYSE